MIQGILFLPLQVRVEAGHRRSGCGHVDSGRQTGSLGCSTIVSPKQEVCRAALETVFVSWDESRLRNVITTTLFLRGDAA
jgi:hypothetical protein